jgi:hypothetical protein
MRSRFLFPAGLVVASTIAAPARAGGAGDGDSLGAAEPWHVEAVKSPAAKPTSALPRALSNLPCVFIPRPDCRDYALLELTLAGGESRSYVGWQWALRGSTELGLLVAATHHLHWGPALEVGFDIGRITSGWSAVPKVRGRLWLGESSFMLEGSIGTLFERYAFNDGEEVRNRVGGAADLAFSYHGLGSLLGSVSLGADPLGVGGGEVRLLVGFRASVLTWGLIAASPFMAYGLK